MQGNRQRGMQTIQNIDISSLITGAMLGNAVLYDVKLYQRKKEFIADQSKHFAASTYADYKYDS
jgi:hypothetical protein